MRFELAGTITPGGFPGPGNPSNPPELFLTYNADDTLDAKSYADMGYTAYEVLCVGGAGGAGGGYHMPAIIDATRAAGDWLVDGYRWFGGGGGGGGLHKIAGDLLALPDSVIVKVGAGGVAGTWQEDPDGVASPHGAEDLTVTDSTDGGDGGYSSFNDPTCRASGGKGGKRVQAVHLQDTAAVQSSNPNSSLAVDSLAYGGDGGSGGSVVAGGGGTGGKEPIYDGSGTITTPEVPAVNGTWDGTIGTGGGGGYGGGMFIIAPEPSEEGLSIRDGGRGEIGCYNNILDNSYVSTGTDPVPYSIPHTIQKNEVPGPGGGAQTSPLTGSSAEYGDGVQLPVTSPGGNGVVIVRLTAK